MEKLSRVHVLQALETLVNNVLLVNVLQNVGSDNSMKVGIHEVEDQVDVAIILSTNYVL